MVPYFLLNNNDDSLKGLWNDSEDLTRWNGSAWRILFINSIKHSVNHISCYGCLYIDQESCTSITPIKIKYIYIQQIVQSINEINKNYRNQINNLNNYIDICK